MQNFPKYMMPYYIPFTLSFAKAFFFCGISMGFLWDAYGISEGVLWEFYGILMGFPLDFYGISMVFL